MLLKGELVVCLVFRQEHHQESDPILALQAPQDPDNLMLQILHAENSFLRMGESRLSFLDSCRGSFAHSVVKSRDLVDACVIVFRQQPATT